MLLKLPFMKRRRPGHSWFFETRSVFLRGSVTAQVLLGVGVVPLLDSDVSSGLPPQMLGRFGQTSAFPAQRRALHRHKSWALTLSKFKSLYKWIVLSSRINPPGTRSYPPVTGAEASALAWWAQVNILERVRRIKAVCPVHKETKWFQTLSERYWGLTVKKKSKRRAQRNISTARTRLKWERALWGGYKDPAERRLHYITRCFTPPP